VKLLSIQRFLLQLLTLYTMYSAPKYSSQAPTSKYYSFFCPLFVKRCHLCITPCDVVSNNKVISEKGIGNYMERSTHGTIWGTLGISRRRHKKSRDIRTFVFEPATSRMRSSDIMSFKTAPSILNKICVRLRTVAGCELFCRYKEGAKTAVFKMLFGFRFCRQRLC
jgi:hypothetical protein